MNILSSWRGLTIGLTLVFSVIYALPNIFPVDFALQVSPTGVNNISEADLEKVNKILTEKSVSYKSSRIDDNKILVRFENNKSQLQAQSILKDGLGRSFVLAQNLVSNIPPWLENFGAKALSLGLDLRGGVHFLLEIDEKVVIDNTFNNNFNSLRSTLRDERLYQKRSFKKLGDTIVFNLNDLSQKEQVIEILKDFDDLELVPSSGKQIVLQVKELVIKDAKRAAIKQNITTLKNRVNELGVAEPTIAQQGLDRIIVQLPGVQDTARAKEILGAVATIEFRMVVESASDGIGKTYYFKDGTPLSLQSRVIAKGENIINASSSIDESGAPMVSISLDSAGGKSMLENTKKNLHKRMAVVFIENKVETIYKNGKKTKKRTITKDIINAATIQGTFSTRFQITGLDSSREARNLALLLRAGALSVPIEIIEERTIGPSLGKDNIEKGILSVIAGFILVLLFMVWRYRVFGVVADIALTLNLVIIIAALSFLQATLTLPGIAGIVLTVGMAVDANVLIFERIKEELAKGADSINAIKNGYDRAITTITDANVTTLIAAFVLFMFGTGPIKGFAITLSIGILTSMFTAILVSKVIIDRIYKNKQELKI
jgi:preprotein translocase subunit SecD